jgi:cytochrome c oxidase assembly factor CtaG
MVVAEAVTPMRVMSSWTVDLFALTAIAVAAAMYLIGVARHDARRHDTWPRGRTLAFVLGLLMLLIATQSGLATFEPVFTVHVVQHLVLGMIAPVLLVLAAPITLALRVLAGPDRRRVGRVLRHPVTRTLFHPVAGWSLFAGSVALVYLTPLYGASVRSSAVHVWLHAHFLLAGLLFCWPLLGVDAALFRVPHPLRLLVVLLALPFHAFVAVALLGGPEELAAAGAARVLALGIDPIEDVRTGAALLWAIGDFLAVVLAGAIAVSWMRTTERRARLAEGTSAQVGATV